MSANVLRWGFLKIKKIVVINRVIGHVSGRPPEGGKGGLLYDFEENKPAVRRGGGRRQAADRGAPWGAEGLGGGGKCGTRSVTYALVVFLPLGGVGGEARAI